MSQENKQTDKKGHGSELKVLKKKKKKRKMVKKYLKMCLSSLAIREMKLEITLGFHITQVGMAKMNKIADNKLTVN